jgi:hypothetical protein
MRPTYAVESYEEPGPLDVHWRLIVGSTGSALEKSASSIGGIFSFRFDSVIKSREELEFIGT